MPLELQPLPIAPGSGHIHVQSPDVCNNRIHCWGHKEYSQALCPVHYIDILQEEGPSALWGTVTVLMFS